LAKLSTGRIHNIDYVYQKVTRRVNYWHKCRYDKIIELIHKQGLEIIIEDYPPSEKFIQDVLDAKGLLNVGELDRYLDNIDEYGEEKVMRGIRFMRIPLEQKLAEAEKLFKK
jgi:hypothetical protein